MENLYSIKIYKFHVPDCSPGAGARKWRRRARAASPSPCRRSRSFCQRLRYHCPGILTSRSRGATAGGKDYLLFTHHWNVNSMQTSTARKET